VGAGPLKDIAHLFGGFNPTGTITFTLVSPSSVVVDTETVAVLGNGDYSTPFGYIPLSPGTYQWDASYSGDGNNGGASDVGDPNEQVTVFSATLALTTTLSSATITAGGSASDTAHLSGGFNPTGTITFFYSATNTCPAAGATQVGSPVSVLGNGDYPSSSQTFTVAGTYYWYAVYSGDVSNNPMTSACEPLVVQPAQVGVPEFPTPMLVTTAIAFLALAVLTRTKSGKGAFGRRLRACLPVFSRHVSGTAGANGELGIDLS